MPKREKKIPCSFCDRLFSQKSHLSDHIRIHTKEKPFSCTYCDAKFSRRDTLVKHIRIHTKEKPFGCLYCDSKFSHRANLTSHVRTHAKGELVSCLYCDYKGAEKENLVNHMRIHTNFRQYSCSYCAYRCTQKVEFDSHLATHSEKEEFSSHFNSNCSSIDSSLSSFKTDSTNESLFYSYCVLRNIQEMILNDINSYSQELLKLSRVCETSYEKIKSCNLICHVYGNATGDSSTYMMNRSKCTNKELLDTHTPSHFCNMFCIGSLNISKGSKSMKSLNLKVKPNYSCEYKGANQSKLKYISETCMLFKQVLAKHKYVFNLSSIVKHYKHIYVKFNLYNYCHFHKLFRVLFPIQFALKNKFYFRCLYCFCSFNKPYLYYFHIMMHHRKRLGKKCVCILCSFKTSSEMKMKIHLSSHSYEGPFLCSYCQFAAYNLISLNKHLQSCWSKH